MNGQVEWGRPLCVGGPPLGVFVRRGVVDVAHVAAGAVGGQVGVVDGGADADGAGGAAEDEREVVRHRRDVLERALHLVVKHVVVRRPRGALQRVLTDQKEVVPLARGDPIRDQRAREGIEVERGTLVILSSADEESHVFSVVLRIQARVVSLDGADEEDLGNTTDGWITGLLLCHKLRQCALDRRKLARPTHVKLLLREAVAVNDELGGHLVFGAAPVRLEPLQHHLVQIDDPLDRLLLRFALAIQNILWQL